MRVPLRTLVLMLISFVWGAALYAALFSSSRHDAELEDQNVVGRWTPEELDRELVGGYKRDGGGNGRHLTEHEPPADSMWRQKPQVSRSQNEPRIPGSDFSIREPFHFPLPHYSLRKLDLLGSPWVAQLQHFLRGISGSQVSLVTASIEHQDVLLNWLISAYLVATPPLQNVLVLTLDKSVFDLVSQRNLSALYVHEDMVIRRTANVTRRFSQVHVVRLSVLRLMNYYGFSVVNYDCDAIVLKNPQPIFEGHKDADIIGTFGKGPAQLYEKWGITLNTGVMLLRSNAKLEYYWELMSSKMSEDHSSTDDQANINLVLEKIHTRWVNFDRSKNIDYLRSEVYGIGNRHIIIMLLPESKVCRYVCDPKEKDDYYVWHTYAIKENSDSCNFYGVKVESGETCAVLTTLTVLNKMYQARVGSVWFLRSDWLAVSQGEGSLLKNVAWLRYIADPNLIR